MAQGISGYCSCGFKAEQLMSGVLMLGDSFRIVACADCKVLKSIKNKDASLQKCGQCNHEMSDVGYHGADKYVCPSCMKTELFLYPTLMVD